MTKVQALKLKAGDRVLWDNSIGDTGVVLAKETPNAIGIPIKWINGEIGSMHPADMGPVSLDPRFARPGVRQMSGRSGRALSSHTRYAQLGFVAFSLSPTEVRIIERAIGAGGVTYVAGPEVARARMLAVSLHLGTLEDQGRMGAGGNADGERWTFTLAPGVLLK